ncbi:MULTISPECIES: alpha/beta fold hydrolase [unclassified Halomonas]|uniref:alpha/beta fold hydrolase n=1 Tax=unclassified Halomonas TaxID=2609666 RepID=UPI001C967F7A|nr:MULTISPECIES: alpha/beta hydrolase [unclassified Halomonas]MBY5924082.1 alpha/beta hydrolase [Halomonas sp. DP4Y7-2]MBY6231124.1 alpha/beta hydrolase [Halomonas sp. DP4Y7-1]
MTESHRPTLLFAHANGFPGGSYRSLLAPLKERFDIQPLDRLGHHPDFPVGHNWLALRDEYLDSTRDLPGPFIGVGHSMGGVITAMAARQAPERFQAVVMLDPPLMLGLDAMAMRLSKWLGMVDRVTPAGKSKGRRARWESRDAMRAQLRRKGLFRAFTPEALDDYIEAGTTVLEDGSAVLSYDPDIEVEIFRHLPHHLDRLPREVSVPIGVLAGASSDLLTPSRCRRLSRRGIVLETVPGTHMFPMEQPDATREALLSMIYRLLAPEGARK